MIRDGRFREDLYYRLADRGEDPAAARKKGDAVLLATPSCASSPRSTSVAA